MKRGEKKLIFVTGGVVSSLGKGITSASIGALLRARSLDVGILKCDPYLNVDAGTMNPLQHGEVFVLDDGSETDLDLGHYERFLDFNASQENSLTSGKIFAKVIRKEREGRYLGETIQIIPHVTDTIKRAISKFSEKNEITLIEIGGTVGDIESLPFLEAIRQLRDDLGRESTLFLHLTLVPYIALTGETKTKPTQHSVKELRSLGLQPDVLICRSDIPLTGESRTKISLFTSVPEPAIVSIVNARSIYQVPMELHRHNLDRILLERLKIPEMKIDLETWEATDKFFRKKNQPKLRIAIVGKYTKQRDTYKSLHEALVHSGIHEDTEVEPIYLDSSHLEEDIGQLREYQGIIVPGGFGERGSIGKILSITYARENEIPFLGICFGMQLAVIEFARNVWGFKDADTTEFVTDLKNPAIHHLSHYIKKRANYSKDQDDIMRVGGYDILIESGTRTEAIYQSRQVRERGRHRFTVNKDYSDHFSEQGLLISGRSKQEGLIEIIELPGHPWFLATQFHGEFQSRPGRPHPIFSSFLRAANEH